jgi:selenocysteine lyase/cysteine desulfurase
VENLRKSASSAGNFFHSFSRNLVLIANRTKLLAVGAASNPLGTMPDVTHACRLAKDAGILSFVDAVYYAPHNLVDVNEIDCDFLACSPYKFYGPHLGVLYGRKELLEKTDFPKLKPASNASPERAETGTLSHEAIAGAAAAVDFLASLSAGDSRHQKLVNTYSALHSRQSELTKFLWQELSDINEVTIYGPPFNSPRTSTISFTVKGFNSETIYAKLSE